MGNPSMTKARIYYGEKIVSSISGAGKTRQLYVKERIVCKRMKSRIFLNTTHQKKSKTLRWIKDLNVRLETIIRRNIGRTLLDINPSKIFYNPTPKVMKIKPKINKWDLVKPEGFCTAKEGASQVEQ